MTFDGEPSSEDLIHIARNVISDIDNFSLKQNYWGNGYIGIIQLIMLAKISLYLKNN